MQYFIPAGSETKITNVKFDIMKKLKWYSFEQYNIKAFNVWPVTLPVDILKWLDGLCNCPAFFKKFLCKHVLIGEKGIIDRINFYYL
jgi:hypothetical protein